MVGTLRRISETECPQHLNRRLLKPKPARETPPKLTPFQWSLHPCSASSFIPLTIALTCNRTAHKPSDTAQGVQWHGIHSHGTGVHAIQAKLGTAKNFRLHLDSKQTGLALGAGVDFGADRLVSEPAALLGLMGPKLRLD